MEIKQLTVSEIGDLDRLEKIVEDNMVSWMKVGFALKEIRDRRLYRMSHATFEQYVKERFDYARSTAYQFISGVQVIENVRNADKEFPLLPEKESLVRPLTRLESIDQPRAWENAIARARDTGDGEVMSRHVVWAVNLLKGDPQPTVRSRIDEATGQLPEEFQTAFRTITESIYAAKRKRFEGVDRKKMLQIIEGLKRILEG